MPGQRQAQAMLQLQLAQRSARPQPSRSAALPLGAGMLSTHAVTLLVSGAAQALVMPPHEVMHLSHAQPC